MPTSIEGKIKIAKVNVDENPNSPAQMGVRGIPALFMFKDGQVVSNKIGAAPKAALQSWIEADLSLSQTEMKGRLRAPFCLKNPRGLTEHLPSAQDRLPKVTRFKVLPMQSSDGTIHTGCNPARQADQVIAPHGPPFCARLP